MSHAAPKAKANHRRFPPIHLAYLAVLGVMALPGEARPQGFQFSTGACFPPPPAADSLAALPETPTGALSAGDAIYWYERDQFCLSVFSDSMNARPGVERVREGLAQEAPLIRTQAAQRTLEALYGFSVKELEGSRERWGDFEGMVQDWSRTLSNELELSAAMRTDLDRMQSRWVATAATPDSTMVAVRSQIAEVLSAADALADSVARDQAEIFALTAVVGEMETSVRGVIGRIEEAQGDARSRLFKLTGPPLFQHLLEGLDPGQFVREARGGGQDRVVFIVEWFRRSVGEVLLGAFLVGLLSWLVRRVSVAVSRNARLMAERRESEVAEALESAKTRPPSELAARVAADAEATEQEHVVIESMGRRSLSAGYILSLLFVPLLFSAAPLLVRDLLLLLSTLPMVRLLRAPGPATIRRLATFVTLLYGGYSGMLLVLPNTPVRRMVVFIAALLGFLLVRVLLRWYRDAGPGTWRVAATLVFPAMRIGFMAGALAEFIGLVGLAEMLVTGMISLLYLGLILRILSLAVVGILMAVPFTRVGAHMLALQNHSGLMVTRLRSIMAILGSIVWIWAAFQVFGFVADLQGGLTWVLSMGITVGSLQIVLGDIVAFLFTVWLAFQISRFVRFLLQEEVYPRASLPKGVPATTSSLVHYVILALGAVVALSAAGIDLDRIALLISALGVGIGFGLQGVVGNFVAGLILLFERPVTIGDTVEVGTLMGQVTRVGMRASTVRTYDGAEVIVPNMDLTAGQVINWTLSDRKRRVEMLVGVKYGTDPELVISILQKAAQDHPEVLRDPEPIVLFSAFGESSLDFSLRAWIADFDRGLLVRSELTVTVNRMLREAGVEIPFPQRDLHLRSVDPVAGLSLAGNSPEVGAADGTGLSSGGEPATPAEPSPLVESEDAEPKE